MQKPLTLTCKPKFDKEMDIFLKHLSILPKFCLNGTSIIKGCAPVGLGVVHNNFYCSKRFEHLGCTLYSENCDCLSN